MSQALELPSIEIGLASKCGGKNQAVLQAFIEIFPDREIHIKTFGSSRKRTSRRIPAKMGSRDSALLSAREFLKNAKELLARNAVRQGHSEPRIDYWIALEKYSTETPAVDKILVLVEDINIHSEGVDIASPIEIPVDHSRKTSPSHPAHQENQILVQKAIKQAAANAEKTFLAHLETQVPTFPDFPIKGIMFRPMTKIINQAALFNSAIELVARKYHDQKIDAVLALDSRGYIIGAPLALKLGASFVPITKKGKTPGKTHRATYQKEYGPDELEISAQADLEGKRVLIIDDLIATGGTLLAAQTLAKKAGATVAGIFCLIELVDLHGRDKLEFPFDTLIQLRE